MEEVNIKDNSRLLREKDTIEKMIMIYCKNKHSEDGLCEDCKELIEYADKRLKNCKFGEEKPVCAKCKVHCYKPDMKEKVKNVMKYSGPKMIFYYPKLAAKHFVDGLTKK